MKIVVRKKAGNFGGFVAWLENCPQICGEGKTKEEAIGDLFQLHAGRFKTPGIEIDNG